MTRIVIDRETLARLGPLDQPLEICDETGHTLGFFKPLASYEAYRDLEPVTKLLIQVVETDDCASDCHECSMDVIAAFVANSETAELMEPSDRSFHHPTSLPQSTAMFRVPTSQVRSNATTAEFVAVRLRIVAPVALHALGPLAWTARLASQRRNGFHQRQQLCHVVSVGAGKRVGQWNARRIRKDMVLAPRFATIRRVGASFDPPDSARTLELSTTTRDQSIRSAAWSSTSKISCRRFQTPASCQSRNRRHPHDLR